MPIRRRGSLSRRHPERRAPASRSGPGAFEAQVQAALDGLPPEFQRLLDNVAVVVEDLPSPDQSIDAGDDPEGWLYGIYEGTPLNAWAADQVPFPNVITLFRIPLQQDFRDPAELAWEIQRTVVHELAHHAGIDDARLTELGYD
jgi:predicted Zn-dependent protease with MMP-like domain